MRNIKAKKIVVKIGTNVLADKNGQLDLRVLGDIAFQIAEIKNNKDIIIITSGAIGAGMKELGLSERPKDVIMKQVCAAVGQNILMASYKSFFDKYKIKIAQILLTYDELANKATYKNLSNSLNKLLELGAIPIINENDPISIDEIGPSFGDNDNLSALITKKTNADLLLILTNVDGLYDRNPNEKGASLINEVHKIDKKIESMGRGSSNLGIGGMKTKIDAVKTATEAGAVVIIANGKTKSILIDVMGNKDVGTIFYPK